MVGLLNLASVFIGSTRPNLIMQGRVDGFQTKYNANLRLPAFLKVGCLRFPLVDLFASNILLISISIQLFYVRHCFTRRSPPEYRIFLEPLASFAQKCLRTSCWPTLESSSLPTSDSKTCSSFPFLSFSFRRSTQSNAWNLSLNTSDVECRRIASPSSSYPIRPQRPNVIRLR